MRKGAASLLFRLAGMLGLFFLGGMLALYVAAHSYARLAADRSFDRLLGGSALSIAETLAVIDGRVQVDIPYASLDMLSAAPDDRVFYRVVGPDKTTVTGYPDLPSAPRSKNGEVGPMGQFFDARYRGEDVRFVWLGRQIATPESPGWVYVQVGQTTLAREALARELVLGSLLPILIITVIALGIVWFGVDFGLRPLGRLSDELAARQPEDLHPIVTPVPKEMVPVANSIDDFMRRLRENIEALRSFIADAAHQLRTPLAAIQAQAHVGEDGNIEEMKASLAAVRRNASRLTRLVNQMLSDATVQHRSSVRSFAEFDLIATVRRSIRDAVPQAEDSDVRFKTSLKQAPMVGDRIMMGEIVNNLIQNALTHGRSEHGEVLILLEECGEGYLLIISDRGPGIAESDRELVFERFARRHVGESGAGLGLAIVRRAIVSHDGTITLKGREGGGLSAEIVLPRRRVRP